MAGVADKARFYLERSVPQLREFEEKEIFSKDEIRTLVQKRTEFEHIVLAPGSKPSDFQSYVTWEESLEALRVKRCRRLKVKHSSAHAGQARVFNIYERAVFRHPGSVTLWREYLDYTAKVKATKRWRKVVTRALRMHPTDIGLWALAARRAASDGDMESARSLFMRGCRFCNREPVLWVEYARVEMEWLARMEKRKGVKALDQIRAAETVDEDDQIRFEDDEDDEEEFGVDEVILPDPMASAKAKEARKIFSDEAVKKLEKSPALEGAIPMAIFDIAKKQPFFGAPAAEAFFYMFSSFTSVVAQARIIRHVIDAMIDAYPTHPSTCSCLIQQPLLGLDTNTPEFPKQLRESLTRLKTYLEKTDDKETLATKTVAWIDPILEREDIDTGIRTVLEHTRRKLENP